MNNINNTLFPVKEVPAVFNTEPTPTYKWNNDTGYKFIVREDTNEVLSCMTNKYQLVSNNEVFNSTSAVLKDVGAELSNAEIFGNGARTMWEWKLPNIKIEVRENDFVNPQIIIKNSYDGSTEVSAIAGAYRLICTNGMIIGTTIGKSGIRHNIWTDMDNFYGIVQEMIHMAEQVFSTDFPILIDTPVKQNHIADLIEMLPMQTMDGLIGYMKSHPIKNYWDLLNAGTWITTHQMDSRKEATHVLSKKLYPKIRSMAISN